MLTLKEHYRQARLEGYAGPEVQLAEVYVTINAAMVHLSAHGVGIENKDHSDAFDILIAAKQQIAKKIKEIF
jgi:hypothetical protein